jgi:hypothetical protein
LSGDGDFKKERQLTDGQYGSDGRGGEEVEEKPNHTTAGERLVLYKSFNTL